MSRFIKSSLAALTLVVGFSSNALAASWFVTANGGLGVNPVPVGTEGVGSH